MDAAGITEAARLIVDGRMSARGVRLPPERQPRDEAEAYAVQAELHRQFAETSGAGKRIGWKIGCTTPVMQKLLGIDAPAYGGITEFAVNESRAFYWTGTFARPGVECEIAMRVASDTSSAAAPYTRETIGRHVGACMAAMEVVDNRYGDFRATPVPVMIADDFFQASCVIGPEIADWRKLDLAALRGRILLNGKDMGHGTGAEVMGHPLEALAWLANRLAKAGGKLAAGEFVLTGSFVPVQWIAEFPMEAVVEIESLGSVSARFA
jgi:2-oxo-3-hexenedioate decarboxylase/2-keto-4-pentenoate hydratase